jgi:hypothetical protein
LTTEPRRLDSLRYILEILLLAELRRLDSLRYILEILLLAEPRRLDSLRYILGILVPAWARADWTVYATSKMRPCGGSRVIGYQRWNCSSWQRRSLAKAPVVDEQCTGYDANR